MLSGTIRRTGRKSGTSVATLRVGAIQYLVGSEGISAAWLDPSGATHQDLLARTPLLLSRIDDLREELRDTMAVARGQVPRLRDFAEGWGRELIPDALLESEPDVLVVVPHAFLHDVPLHLIRVEPAGEPLGALIGLTYSSSRSQFIRCASRNPARRGRAMAGGLSGGGADVLTGEHGPFRELVASVKAFFFDGGDVPVRGDQDWPYTRAALKAPFRMPGEFDVLCVVAHGYTDPVNHRMSGLLLQRDPFGVVSRAIPLHGGRYFDFRDLPLRRFPATVHAESRAEVLTGAELEVDGRIDVQLVVLLACSAGWGRVLEGDEPASLAESFLHIGAPSAIAPMWDSAYQPTREWVHGFFEGWLERGQPKALAARHATRLMQSGPYADRPERLGALALRGDWW